MALGPGLAFHSKPWPTAASGQNIERQARSGRKSSVTPTRKGPVGTRQDGPKRLTCTPSSKTISKSFSARRVKATAAAVAFLDTSNKSFASICAAGFYPTDSYTQNALIAVVTFLSRFLARREALVLRAPQGACAIPELSSPTTYFRKSQFASGFSVRLSKSACCLRPTRKPTVSSRASLVKKSSLNTSAEQRILPYRTVEGVCCASSIDSAVA